MTAALAFEPHHDDVALFCAYEAMRLQAQVVTVLDSHIQERYGITQPQRLAENLCAMRELGLEWTQWPYRDDDPDWEAVHVAMRAIDDRLEPEIVLAPAVERGGHAQHSKVGALADDVFGARTVHYLTYTTGGVRSSVGREVAFEPEMLGRKLRALACYRSQIATPSHVHFTEALREYLA